MFLSSKLTHRFEVRVIFVLGQLWKVELISKEGNRISTHTSLGQSITSKCKRKCKCKELLLWTTPTQMQTQASTQGIKKIYIFLSSHLRSLPTRVNKQKLNHCRSSCKNTSTAFAYLYFLAFALDVSNRLHFYLRLHLLLLRTCEPVFRSFYGMTYS